MPERKAEKRLLTDRLVRNLKPRADRFTVLDSDVRSFGIRVNKNGSKSFLLIKRLPGKAQPSALTLGSTDELSLADAREKARDWIKLISRGVDPKKEEVRRSGTTFGAVMEDYFENRLKGQRTAKAAEHEIRKELLSRWEFKPIAEITREDVRSMVDQIVARGAKRQAHNILGHARTFFNWCIAGGLLEHSPCDRLNAARLIGPRVHRTRVLSDTEIALFWKAATNLGYPFGDLFRFLLITGQREGEGAGAVWSEFDLPNKLWTVPEERFKSGSQHLVPLSNEALDLLANLPRHNAGNFVFSSTAGTKPLVSFDGAKKRLLANMQSEMKAPLENFQIHDLRRTVRTRLSELRIPDPVAEMVIGHARKGIQRVYDQHQYMTEMREALDAWGKRLRTIVRGPGNLEVAK